MIPNPIRKVLFTMAAYQVRALLMGGQACVFYGAAEFSRDADLFILAEPENLERLRIALDSLQAECIAVPPFEAPFLHRGHAIHFRCNHPEAAGIRVDVMSVLRGVEAFEKVWERRTSIEDTQGTTYELLSLPDLVRAKKTQRDKDWPMIKRLVEADYHQRPASPSPERIQFWLQELRTPELLIVLAKEFPQAINADCARPLLQYAKQGDIESLDQALHTEEQEERKRDREYWAPLRKELEKLRLERLR